MARIAGVNIPREKRVEIGLTYVYGIGRTTANEILAKVGLSHVEYLARLIEAESLARGQRALERRLAPPASRC